MELRHRDRIVQIKIVYYGPPVGGKTTNLQRLHTAAETRHRGEFISVSSAQDRTILFDLLPLKGVGFHGFEIRFQLVAVPGQSAYAATRRLIVRGADAVVFVANSAADRMQENVTSLREMAEHLVGHGIDPGTIPLVFQYNKRDLPEVLPIETLEKELNYREAPSCPAVAIRGEGVLETLGAVLEQTMMHLIGRYKSLALAQGETVQSWTWEMLTRVFGSSSIAQRDAAEAESPEGRRLVRVSVPRGLNKHGVPDSKDSGNDRARLGGAVAESYVTASLELSRALEQMRDERDEARRRLDELEHTLRAIEAVEEGRPPEAALRDALQRILAGGGCRAATLLGAAPDRTLRLVTAVGLDMDPFLHLRGGPDIVRHRFIPLRKPLLVNPDNVPEVAAAVAPLRPPVKALAAVPVRSALGLHGLVLLYYGQTDPLPSPSVLDHLGHLARVLAAWFSVRRAASARSTVEAVRRSLPELEQALREVGDLVAKAARNPLPATPALEEAARKLDGVVALARELAVPLAPTTTTRRRIEG